MIYIKYIKNKQKLTEVYGMYMEERQQEILRKIEEMGRITIGEITEQYGISNESARRDLRLLHEKGLCKRTHGGAIKIGVVNTRPPREHDMKNMNRLSNYEEIAKVAATMVRENETIYITSGSLGFLMLDYLPRNISYTIVINSPVMADMVKMWNNIEVYLVGGKMRMNGTGSIVDAMARNFISQLNFDKAFLTGGGVEASFGFSNGTAETVEFQRTIIKQSRKNILMMPNQKVGCKAFMKVCEVNEFDMLITDWDSPEEELTKLEDVGVEIILVKEPEEKRE